MADSYVDQNKRPSAVGGTSYYLGGSMIEFRILIHQVRFTTHQCGGQMSEEGVIQSPVHPNRYFHNTNCTWVVTAPSGKVVEIK